MCDEILRAGGAYTRRVFGQVLHLISQAGKRDAFGTPLIIVHGRWMTAISGACARLRIRRVSAAAAATVEHLAAAATLALAQLHRPPALNCLAAEYRATCARYRSKHGVAAGAAEPG
ncbi:hypothetical protein C8R45DRAFT_937479 [Mycena sanguinolenta]|nr:hypothetical protein C8R45DRAFT_937479 [Mycena sanguinolenta]